MRPYLTMEGHDELMGLRVNPIDIVVASANNAPIRLLARVPSEECGCPEELWHVDGLIYLIHMEEDGTSDMFLFTGDEEHERNVEAATLDELRAFMFAWHYQVVNSGEDP